MLAEPAAVAVGAVLASTVAFRRLLRGPGVNVAIDYVQIHIPFRREISRALVEGQLPLWSAQVYSGAPFLANGDSAVLYPLQFFFFLTDAPRAVGLVLWLHVALAMATMYVFARVALGVGPAGAAVAAVVYGFNGYAMAHTGFLSFVYIQPWPPLVLLAVVLATERSLAWCALGSVALAMATFSGQPQQLYLLLVWLPVFAVPLLATKWSKQRLGRVTLAIALIGVWGFGLAAAQIVPQAEYVGTTARGSGLSLAEATFGSLPPESPLSVLLPDYDKSFMGENAGWVGGAATALAAFGILVLVRRRRWAILGAWLTIAVMSFVLALGSATPVYGWAFRLVPGMAQFRFPVRWLFMMTFAVAVLAAYGADAVDGLRWRDRLSRRAAGIVITAGCCIGAVIAALFIHDWDARTNLGVGTAIALGGIGVFLDTRVVAGQLPRAAGLTMAFFVGLELLAANAFLEWNHPGQRSAYELGPLAARIAADGADGRVLSVASPQPGDWVDAAARLHSDTPLLSPTASSVNGLNGLGMPGEMRQVLVHVLGPLQNDDPAATRRMEVWRGLGVRWLIARETQAAFAHNSALVEVARDNGLVLYELRPKGERVAAYCGSISLPTAAAAAEWATGDGYSTDLLALPGVPAHPGGSCGRAVIASASRSAVAIAASLPIDGWVLLKDTWYPGWRVTVDGVPSIIEKANGFYRAVRVPAGTHQVRFEYAPDSVRYGVATSFVAWLALFTFVVTMGWKRVQRRSTS